MVSLINLPATILQIAGVKVPKEMRYPPLQNALSNKNWKDTVFYQISESFVGRGIRTPKWKYCVHAPHLQDEIGGVGHEWSLEKYYEMVSKSRKDSDSYVELALHDLENDPFEKRNLVNEPAYAEIRSEMAKKLIELMVEAREDPPKIYPAGTVLKSKDTGL